MTLQQKNIYGWQGYVWESDDIAVGLVPQLGGRIMSLKFRGEELLFVQQEHAGETFDLSQLAVNKKQFGFRLWGGDKTWVAPEGLWADRIPPLDLDAGNYTFSFDKKKRQAAMVSPVCRETGLRITREVQLSEGNRFVLAETVKNESRLTVTRGIWNVTQLLRPFEICFPCGRQDVRLYDDAAYQSGQPNSYLREEGGWTVISCRDTKHFKFGALLREGKITARRRTEKAAVVLSKTFPILANAKYAHGSHAEVYNSPAYPYCEIEVHSPLLTLEPGQAFSQSQEWNMFSQF